MKENEFQGDLIKAFRLCNAIVFNIQPNRYTTKGCPDLYVSHIRWQGWIEVKGEKTVLEEHQKRILQGLRKRGDKCFIIRYPNLIQNENGNTIHKYSLMQSILRILEELERRFYG